MKDLKILSNITSILREKGCRSLVMVSRVKISQALFSNNPSFRSILPSNSLSSNCFKLQNIVLKYYKHIKILNLKKLFFLQVIKPKENTNFQKIKIKQEKQTKSTSVYISVVTSQIQSMCECSTESVICFGCLV